MLQYIKEHYTAYSNEALYASLDNIWFFRHSLLELADEFHKMGGKTLFLDEVHKYPTWSVEIKNIYDSYPDMKLFLPVLLCWKFIRERLIYPGELSFIICMDCHFASF